jgi:hypothetical protein
VPRAQGLDCLQCGNKGQGTACPTGKPIIFGDLAAFMAESDCSGKSGGAAVLGQAWIAWRSRLADLVDVTNVIEANDALAARSETVSDHRAVTNAALALLAKFFSVREARSADESALMLFGARVAIVSCRTMPRRGENAGARRGDRYPLGVLPGGYTAGRVNGKPRRAVASQGHTARRLPVRPAGCRTCGRTVFPNRKESSRFL